MDKFSLQKRAKFYLNGVNTPADRPYALMGCHSKRISSDVVVLGSSQSNAFYGNLATCCSPWVCPVCATKISERRRLELGAFMELHSDSGGFMVMITLTIPHTRTDKLTSLLGDSKRNSGFRAALRRFRNSRGFKRTMKTLGYVGLVRSLEVTYGANGWHPHSHELYFFDGKLKMSELLKTLQSYAFYVLWRDACLKSALGSPSHKHGIDARASLSASDYLTKFGTHQKWGASAELTKQHIKKGNNSLTPFDFLRATDDLSFYSSLFKEYANAFFGVRQLFYSRGFKSFFKTDEEIIKLKPNDSYVMFRINKADWTAILALPYDARQAILNSADLGEYDFYKKLLEN